MRVVTAPDSLEVSPKEISVFLAGGIQKTEDWQKIVIKELYKIYKNEPIVLFNPRRDNFPIHDPNAAFQQIKWEYDALNIVDIFSMFFAKGDTDEPICQYEYGKHLERRYVNDDLDRLVVSSEPEYRRYQDVIIQTQLVSPKIYVGKSIVEHVNSLSFVIKKQLAVKRNGV